MESSLRRTREEGEALVKRFRESGQTQREFAESTGVKICALQYWLRKVAKEGACEGGLTTGLLVDFDFYRNRVSNAHDKPSP